MLRKPAILHDLTRAHGHATEKAPQMAQFFPARSACRFDTPGERRLAERLEKKLEDDYLCWFNIPVGPKALQPDFVVLHPQRGVLVLE
ncbi:NERD domain-containing protein, partial [Azotobacter chroococcum]|nr:NERD domain-containing protein [Azotobacter chroococcum]